MAVWDDRVSLLLEGTRHKRKVLLTPEGVPFSIRIPMHVERLAAFLLDIMFMFAVIILLYVLLISLFFSDTNLAVSRTVILFAAFVVRNLYFVHFELAWQGRTPGKRICNLRVINREGGELTPSAVIARNLTREVEFFLPLSLFFALGSGWQALVTFCWALAVTAVPFFNKEHLRAGDIIAGTQVISMPKRVLLEDISVAPLTPVAPAAAPDGPTIQFAAPPPAGADPTLVAETQAAPSDISGGVVSGTPDPNAGRYVFAHDQLAIYGAFELQVLEDLLRRPDTKETQTLLEDVCRRICRKINWAEPVPPSQTRRFLTDFYTAERADLERGQLFGNVRADKTDAPKR